MPTTPDLKRSLRERRVLVADGAMATRLFGRGLRPGDCPERWNLERPDPVAEVAAEYADAGADLVLTNTFGASPTRLARSGLADRLEEINRTAVALARRGVAGRAAVVGAVGPTGLSPAELARTDIGEIARGFGRQIEALLAAGVDGLMVETMSDLREAEAAVRAARRLSPGVPILAAMSFARTPRGFLAGDGTTVAEAAAGLAAAGADAVGANCCNGIRDIYELALELVAAGDRPVVIKPNAGLPQVVDGHLVYPEGPADFGLAAGRLRAAGVAVIGGCCGTNREHIRAVARACAGAR